MIKEQVTKTISDFESSIATAKPGSLSLATVEESITISRPVSNTEGESSSGETNVEVQNAPQKCACDLHGAWLDIVLVFDSSKAISRQDFRAVCLNIVWKTEGQSGKNQFDVGADFYKGKC